MHDGEQIAVAVRPFKRAEEKRFCDQLECIAKQLPRDVAARVVLITERDFSATDIHNAELIHAVRLDADPESDATVQAAIASITQPISIAALVDLAGQQGRSFRSIVRLIADRALTMVKPGRIEYAAIVSPATVVEGAN
jgi:hypothetical protein